ncbi:MAG: hypothetical protein IJK89_06330 [Clostridia bacterium]|nr:hypothetical protein [Clostridia bacterium]
MGEIKKKKREGLSTDIDIEIASPTAKAVLLALLVLMILTFTVYQVYMVKGSHDHLKTQTAIMQTVSRSVTAKGFIIREEQYVNNPHTGTVVPAVSNGSKVAIDDTVARIYPTEEAARNAARIEELNESIEFYRSVSSATTGVSPNDLELYKQNAVEALIALSDAVKDNDLSRFGALSGDLRTAITKKQIACGNTVDVSEKLSELVNERSALESSLSACSSVISDVSGYYVASADGYETLTDFSGVKELTASDVEALTNSTPAVIPAGTVGKLVTKFSWYLVCNVMRKDIRDISAGDSVSVSFLHSSVGVINMYVSAINEGEQEDVVTLVLKSNKMSSAIATLRKETIKISLERYKGFVVNPKAVRTVDGVKGVYVKLGNIVKFRKIDIAYSDDSMILATCPDGESGYLKQYDEIIIEGTDLYDGKNID